MKLLMRTFLAVLFLITWLATPISAEDIKKTTDSTATSSRVKIGDTAPDFALKADTGELVHLSDYRKKKRVILFFFTGVESLDCEKLCCGFRDCYKKYKEKDGEILAISPNSVDENKKFKAEHQLTYLLLSDPDNKIRNQWHVPVQDNGKECKTTYMIDKRGQVKKIITSQGTPAEYMKEIDAGWDEGFGVNYMY